MRVIDADTHISAESAGNGYGIDELIKEMDRCQVEVSIAWPMFTCVRNLEGDNKAIADGIQRYPNRIIGFGGLNPMLGMDRTLAELERCARAYGFRGVKINGANDGYRTDDPKLVLPLAERLNELGLVLAIHTDAWRAHPYAVATIARAFPELTILMVHMGGEAIPGFYEEAIDVAKEFPHITLVGSEADPKAVLRAIRELGAQRVAYGSDTPFAMMRVSLAAYTALLEDIPAPDRALVMGGNMARLFGL